MIQSDHTSALEDLTAHVVLTSLERGHDRLQLAAPGPVHGAPVAVELVGGGLVVPGGREQAGARQGQVVHAAVGAVADRGDVLLVGRLVGREAHVAIGPEDPARSELPGEVLLGGAQCRGPPGRGCALSPFASGSPWPGPMMNGLYLV